MKQSSSLNKLIKYSSPDKKLAVHKKNKSTAMISALVSAGNSMKEISAGSNKKNITS